MTNPNSPSLQAMGRNDPLIQRRRPTQKARTGQVMPSDMRGAVGDDHVKDGAGQVHCPVERPAWRTVGGSMDHDKIKAVVVQQRLIRCDGDAVAIALVLTGKDSDIMPPVAGRRGHSVHKDLGAAWIWAGAVADKAKTQTVKHDGPGKD